jgi:glycerol-3-phosphate dehydrogenase (NAD(P)+)
MQPHLYLSKQDPRLAVVKKAAELGVEMPITQAIYQILYQGRGAREVIDELMSRELKTEFNNF